MYDSTVVFFMLKKIYVSFGLNIHILTTEEDYDYDSGVENVYDYVIFLCRRLFSLSLK